MGDRLSNKNAVVTGAGRGIGREIALALAAEGARVVVNDIGTTVDGAGADKSVAAEVVSIIQKNGGTAVPCVESIADFDGAKKIIQTCVDSFGGIDILVNVAGILRDHMSFNMPYESWEEVIKVNLTGTFNTCRHAIVLMRQQRYGRIINTASDAWKSTVGHVNYGAAKGGVVSLTYSLARELGQYGITCNAIAPQAATRMTLSEDRKEGQRKRFEAGLITKEQYEKNLDMPGPDMIPPIVVYLASDYAANVNGSVFGCGGGKIALNSEPVEVRGIYRDYKKEGAWTLDELITLMPNTLLAGYVNRYPIQKDKDK